MEKNILRLNKFLESKILQQNIQIEQIYDQTRDNLKILNKIDNFFKKKKKYNYYLNKINFFLILIIFFLLFFKFINK